MDLIQCTPRDIPVLREIAIQTYEETFARDNKPEDIAAYLADAFSLEKLGAEMANPASSFFLVMAHDRATGYLKLNEAPAQTELNDEKSLEIERIYVVRDYHGTGCGKLLLEKALALAVEGGKEYIWLGVWEKNHRARRFYEKNGFRRFGEHIFQLGSDKQTDHLLRKELVPARKG